MSSTMANTKGAFCAAGDPAGRDDAAGAAGWVDGLAAAVLSSGPDPGAGWSGCARYPAAGLRTRHCLSRNPPLLLFLKPLGDFTQVVVSAVLQLGLREQHQLL
jgi:hypothetical protein